MAARERTGEGGWGWLEQPAPAVEPGADLCRAALACFGTAAGELVLRHLQRVFLDRRVPPTAPDAELRHVEGQRSVIAYLGTLLERARQEERF